jgi:hypothetical protein
MKIASIDCETTGIDRDYCDMLEFGCVLDDLEDRKPIEDLPTFHCYFRPWREGDVFQGEPGALSMHPQIFKNINENNMDLYNIVSPQNFGNMFKQFLIENGYAMKYNKVVINVAGKNPSFDVEFLKKRTDIDKHVIMRHIMVDPAILFYEEGDKTLPGLGRCKERAGLDPYVDHTAVADAIDIVNLIRYKL